MRALVICVCTTLAVVLSTATAQRAPPSVSLVGHKHVRIGSVEGPPETLFSGIVGAVLLPNGGIVVGDGGNQVIRFFSSSGAHIRSIGREGRGPGEFLNLRWIGACPNGELLAVDPKLGRLMAISRDGRLLRTLSLPPKLIGSQILSCERGEQILALLRVRDVGEPGKVMRAAVSLARFMLDSASPDTLAQLPGTDLYFASRVAGYSPLPLGARAHAASNGGRVYLAQNNEAQIRVIDLSTSRRSSFEHGLARSKVTGAAWRAAKNEEIEQLPLAETRRLVADVLAEAPAPDLQPAFLDMKADRSGRLWLRLPGSTSLASWRVYSPEGRHFASVTLPANVEPLDIGDRHLIGVERDSLGVQTIVAHTFPRPFIPQEKASSRGN